MSQVQPKEGGSLIHTHILKPMTHIFVFKKPTLSSIMLISRLGDHSLGNGAAESEEKTKDARDILEELEASGATPGGSFGTSELGYQSGDNRSYGRVSFFHIYHTSMNNPLVLFLLIFFMWMLILPNIRTDLVLVS